MELLELLKDPVTLHLTIAAFLGSVLGFERELARKDPSLRTFMLIAVGSCAFCLISIEAATKGNTQGDTGRIAAQVVVGIGFLGGPARFLGLKIEFSDSPPRHLCG